MNHEHEQSRTGSTSAEFAHSYDDTVEPGQSSRSAHLRKPDQAVASALGRSPVQRASVGAAPTEAGQTQVIADEGVRGAGGGLPHGDRIARLFGHHDVSGVRAAVGGAAADASRALSARAYATGDAIGFAEQPDLRLAAHEAAHVVQQRAGVQLDDGIDRRDDAYERHADQVADLVVRGESAEALLDGGGGGASAGSGGSVQRAVQRFSPDQVPAERAAEARRVLRDLEPLDAEDRTQRMRRWPLAYFDELLGAISAEDRRSYPVVIAAIEATRTRRSASHGRAGHEHGAAGDGASGGTAPATGTDAAIGTAPATGTDAAIGTSPATGTAATAAGTSPASTAAPSAPVDDATAWVRLAAAFPELPPDVCALFPVLASGEQLAQIFTPGQRDKLTSFIASRQIPDRLFNGGDVAHAPAQPEAVDTRQRILISAHIMTTGTYANPAQEQQRVEARMCGHFVTLINAYAGVGDANAHDVRGSTDYRGDIVLFTGTAGRATAFGGDYFPVDRFGEIEPGDWLYIQGVDEAGHIMDHSVVFGGWENTTLTAVAGATPPVEARTATTYDQRHNGRGEGGIRHESSRLGTRPVYHPYVWGVTRVAPPQDTNIATTVEDLLPAGVDLEGAAGANRAGLESAGIALPAAMEHIRTANAAMIETIGARRAGGDHSSRLSPEQRALLEDANGATNLEQLVHLNERLQRLAASVAALEAGDAVGAHAYRANAVGNEDSRAAGGYFTTAGHIPHDTFDNNDEHATTGLLQHARPRLPGYSASPAPAARRGGRGGGRAASTGG